MPKMIEMSNQISLYRNVIKVQKLNFDQLQNYSKLGILVVKRNSTNNLLGRNI